MTDEVYVDPGDRLGHFMDEGWSSCPKCAGLGDRTRTPDVTSTSCPARMVCQVGSHTQDWINDAWFGPTLGSADVYCDLCDQVSGREFIRRQLRDDLPSSAFVECARCGRKFSATIRWVRSSKHIDVDPYFGFPLFLRTACGAEVVWAYNLRHLGELLRFARARVRQRGRPNTGLTMIARLPRGMKLRKHRDRVVRCLELLEEKAKRANGKVEPRRSADCFQLPLVPRFSFRAQPSPALLRHEVASFTARNRPRSGDLAWCGALCSRTEGASLATAGAQALGKAMSGAWHTIASSGTWSGRRRALTPREDAS